MEFHKLIHPYKKNYDVDVKKCSTYNVLIKAITIACSNEDLVFLGNRLFTESLVFRSFTYLVFDYILPNPDNLSKSVWEILCQ